MSETKTDPNTEHGIAADAAELTPFSIADAGNVPVIVEPEVRRPRRTKAPHERKTAKDWVWLASRSSSGSSWRCRSSSS